MNDHTYDHPNDHTFNVLFLCTSNAARSIMAEALHKRIELFTPLPIKTLDRMSLQASLHEIGKTA